MMVAAACGRAAHRRKILAWGEEGRGRVALLRRTHNRTCSFIHLVVRDYTAGGRHRMRETERGEGAGGRGLAAPPHRQAQPAAVLRHSPDRIWRQRANNEALHIFWLYSVVIARGSRVMPAGRSQARVTARHIGCKFKQKKGRLKSLVKTCEARNRSLRSVGSRETSNRSDPIASGRPTWC